MWKTYWFIVLSKYKLTGPLLGNFNQMPKKCICVFNICTGYVVAVKNVATLVPSPHLRSRCWWLFGRWTAGSSGQSKSFHCCVSFGGVSVFCMSTIYVHHLGLRFLCHIWFGILGPLLVGFASSWMSGILVSSSCDEQMCCGTTRSLIVWLFSSNQLQNWRTSLRIGYIFETSLNSRWCLLSPTTDRWELVLYHSQIAVTWGRKPDSIIYPPSLRRPEAHILRIISAKFCSPVRMLLMERVNGQEAEKEFKRYIWSASVFFLPFLLFESWVLISAANFNATWQSMHCNVWEYSFLPQHLYNCQRKAGTRHGQSITSVNRDVGLFVQYIIVLNIQLLFPPASLQFGSCHHFAIF